MADNILALERFNISGASPDTPRVAYYDAILHTSNHDFRIDMLMSVYEKNDFINNQSTYLEIEGQLPLGDFLKFIYPERESLSVTLINTTIGNKHKMEYHLILKDIDSDIKSKMLDTTPMSELNKSYTHFRAQCLSKTFKHMRTKTTEGVYKDSTLYDVLTTILLKEFSLFSGMMGYFNNGLILSPLDNDRKYEHIIIPNATNIIDIPAFLQNHKTYGLYNGGVSLFFMSSHFESLYIFPTHKHTTRIGERSLEIFGLTSTDISTIESTYTLNGDRLKILVRKEDRDNEDDIKLKDRGTKIISTEANAVVSRPYQISNGKLELNADWLINRQDHKKIDDGLTPVKKSDVTGNQYALRSEVLKDSGIVLKLHWNHSNVSLLTPMMSVRYVEEIDGKLKKFDGVLQRYDAITDNNGRVENAILFIFVNENNGMTNDIMNLF